MKQKATLAVISAGALWGLITIFVHELTAAGLSSLQISIGRAVGAGFILFLYLLIRNPELLKIRLRHIWYFIGTGIISLTLFNWCYFSTITHSQTSIAVLLLYTSPIFVTLFSAVLFKEKMNARKFIALFLTFSGCVCVSGVIGGGGKIPTPVLLVGLASGLFYALYSIFARYALENYSPITITVYTFIFGAISSLPFGHPLYMAQVITGSLGTFLWYIGICLCCTLLPYLLYTYGLNHMQAGRAAILVTVEPLVGSLLGIFVYLEPHNPQKILGMALIFLAVILLNLPQKETK